MADGVVYHPSAKLRKKIDGLANPDTSDLIELLIEHYDSKCDRTHLGNVVKDGHFSSVANPNDILRLLAWASNKSFLTELEDESDFVADAGDGIGPIGAAGLSGSRAEAFSRIAINAYNLAEVQTRLDEAFRRIGESEKYGNFPPSWGLDTAQWFQTFGDHDPIPAIAFYLANFFEDGIETKEYLQIILVASDLIIWRCIIDAMSALPWRIGIDEPDLTREQKKRALNVAFCLPDEIGEALTIADQDLCEIIKLSPGWMASRLIEWWATHDFDWLSPNEVGVVELIPDQIDLVYRIMVKHLVDWRHLDRDELQEQFSVTPEVIGNLPDYFPTYSRSYEKIVEAFWEANWKLSVDRWYLSSLTKAVYLARSRIFRSRFPFPSDSIFALGNLDQEEGYWLAHFCNAKENPQQIFKYLSFLTERVDDDPWIARLQLVEKARERMNAYENALGEMIRDCNLELARAWWAFFMASQSQMFSGFGLGSVESRRIIAIAENLLPDEGLEMAFEFVRTMAADAKDPLDERIVNDLLPRKSNSAAIVDLAPRQADDFFGERITRGVWERLHPETRQDIRDADTLWTMSYREMGAGRIDWGGVGVIYARAFEREMKAHVTPLLKSLREGGVIGGRKWDTIGSIVKACEDASALLRDQVGHPLSNVISELDDAFRGELRVITAIRNRAAHGDNSDPVLYTEFIELRTAIFVHGAFRIIVDCGNPIR